MFIYSSNNITFKIYQQIFYPCGNSIYQLKGGNHKINDKKKTVTYTTPASKTETKKIKKILIKFHTTERNSLRNNLLITEQHL